MDIQTHGDGFSIECLHNHDVCIHSPIDNQFEIKWSYRDAFCVIDAYSNRMHTEKHIVSNCKRKIHKRVSYDDFSCGELVFAI